MLATCAFLSMWISNTAAAAMMVPIAIAVVDLVLRTRTGSGFDPKKGIPEERVDERNFATALVLAIAYGASIGGVATLIGSPPNGIAAKFIQQTYGVEVTFLKWLAVGLPLTLVMLPVVWFILVRIAFRSRLGPVEGGREFLDAELRKLGPCRAASGWCSRCSWRRSASGSRGRGWSRSVRHPAAVRRTDRRRDRITLRSCCSSFPSAGRRVYGRWTGPTRSSCRGACCCSSAADSRSPRPPRRPGWRRTSAA
jgi:hypothetical protein